MRTTRASYRPQDRVPSRSQRRPQAFPLAARIARFLVALVLLGQAGSTASGSAELPRPRGVLPVAADPSARGAPDPGFGVDGVVVRDFFGDVDQAHAVAQQADGKILVAGWARPDDFPGKYEGARAVVVRLLADGTPDTTFGDGGAAFVEGGDHYFFDLAIQPDGKIVAVGESLVTLISGNGRIVVPMSSAGLPGT